MNKKNKAKHIPSKVKVPVKVSDKKIESNPVEEKEYIQWAAIEIGNEATHETKILKGFSHSSILDFADNCMENHTTYKCLRYGFLTNTGRFVDRAEAHQIAFGTLGILESWMMQGDKKYGVK